MAIDFADITKPVDIVDAFKKYVPPGISITTINPRASVFRKCSVGVKQMMCNIDAHYKDEDSDITNKENAVRVFYG